MSLKKLKILGVIMAFLLCFPLHFLYDKIPSFITSIISPVNESIWEHMKILFGSILFSGVIQKIIVKVKHLNYKNVCISNVIASISSIPIFLIFYLPIYSLIGEKILMLITIIISQLITISIINMKKDLKLENASILFIIIIYIILTYLTYNPLKYKLFKDPINNIYGIKKES